MGCCSIPTTRKIPEEDKDTGLCGIKKTSCWGQVMAFEINKFRSEIDNGGVLKPNRFMVQFLAPPIMNGYNTDKLLLRCEAVQWPGVSFTTMDAPPRAGYGASEVIPIAPIFEDVTLNFIIDKNSNLHMFFFNWINTVVNLRSRGQSRYNETENEGYSKGYSPYEVGYKDEYCTDIEIHMIRETGENDKAMSAKLYRAFPRALPGFDLNWASNDEMYSLHILTMISTIIYQLRNN